MNKQGARAFPKPQSAGIVGDAQPGMTMRQYYKAAVMQGLCANPGGPFQQNSQSGWALVNSSFHQLSIEAGELADAMLAEDAEFEARS